MWNKILIVALLIFSGSVYVFITTHAAMSQPQGEAATTQQLQQDITTKVADIALDERIKAYADMRTEHFEQESASYDAKKEDFDTQSSDMQTRIEELNASAAKVDAEFKSLEESLSKVMQEGAIAVGAELGSFEISDISASIVALDENIKVTEKKIGEVDASIAAGEVEDNRLNAIIAKIEGLNSDRQARLSPLDLACTVLSSDSNWNYVILDAGADKGIVIGSNVAIMRGDVKIGELLITLVEKNRASGDIVFESMLPGEVIKVGDKIVSARKK